MVLSDSENREIEGEVSTCKDCHLKQGTVNMLCNNGIFCDRTDLECFYSDPDKKNITQTTYEEVEEIVGTEEADKIWEKKNLKK